MVHTVELNWGKPINYTPPSPPMSHDVLCKCCVSTAMFVPAVTTYLNSYNCVNNKFVVFGLGKVGQGQASALATG